MSLEVYYQQDIRNALLAAEQASNAALLAASREDDKFAQGFQSGFRAALGTMALAFGLVQLDNRKSREWEPTFLPVNGKAKS
jgi:hypothetical protein